MEVKTYIPHPALQNYVLNIATVDATLPVGITDVVTPYPPTPFQSLFFYCNDPIAMRHPLQGDFVMQPLVVLIGPAISSVQIKVSKRIRGIRVDFLPGGIYRMLGIPMHELFDDGFDAIDFFGAEMKTIQEQLQNIIELKLGIKIIEKFLLSQLCKLKDLLPLDHAMRMLLQADGKMAIEKTAAISCLSLKQFERRCQERIGMNPKMYARILRFSKAYRIHESSPNTSWISIAHTAGYYDQMHMIRDFKVFAGVNPSVIEQQLLATPLRMQNYLPL